MSFNAGVDAFLLQPAAANVEVIAIQSEKIAPERRAFESIVHKRKITIPEQTTKSYGPVGPLSHLALGAIPPRVQQEMDYAKKFRRERFGGSVYMYESQARDAKNIGGGAEQLLQRVKNSLPEAGYLIDNLIVSNLLIGGIQGNTLPTEYSTYLDVNTADDKTWFNNAHTYQSSAETYSNIPTANLDVSEASTSTIYQIFNDITSPIGTPMNIMGKRILTARNIKPQFDVLYGSAYQVLTANNAVNSAKFNVEGTKCEVFQFLPDNMYFVISDAADGTNAEDNLAQEVEYVADSYDTHWDSRTQLRQWMLRREKNFQAPLFGFGVVPNAAPTGA